MIVLTCTKLPCTLLSSMEGVACSTAQGARASLCGHYQSLGRCSTAEGMQTGLPMRPTTDGCSACGAQLMVWARACLLSRHKSLRMCSPVQGVQKGLPVQSPEVDGPSHPPAWLTALVSMCQSPAPTPQQSCSIRRHSAPCGSLNKGGRGGGEAAAWPPVANPKDGMLPCPVDDAETEEVWEIVGVEVALPHVP